MKKFVLTFLGLLLGLGNLKAADFYWRGDNGNWSDGTKWFDAPTGGAARNAVPTATDDVFFNVNSFTVAGQTVIVDIAAVCRNISWTGATNAPAFAIDNPLTVSGSLVFIPGMTLSGTGLVTFDGTGAQTIDMAGLSFGGAATFNNAAGNWTLTGAFGTANALTFAAGAVSTGGFAVSCGQLIHAAAETINLGTSTVTITGAGTGAGTSPFESTSAGTFTSNLATLSFTNTASVASEVRLGNTVRTYGSFVFAAPAAATKSVSLVGAANHTLGNVTLGGNTSLTTPANAYTYASLTAGASTETAVLVSLGGNSTFTGLVNIGDNTGFQTAAGSTNSFAAVTIGASVLAGAGAVNFNGTNTYAGLLTLANNAIAFFNDTNTFNAGLTAGNDVTTGFSLNVGNAAAQTTFATAGTIAFGNNLRGATAANIFSRRTITSSRPITFGNNAGNGAALNWCENGGTITLNAGANLTLNRDAQMNFKGSGNNLFQTITATDGGTVAGNRNLQFMNTGTLTFAGAQNLNSLGNTIGVANTVTNVSTNGATTYGRANAITFGNTGTLTFTGTLTTAAGTVGPANTTFTVNNSVGNVVITGNTSFGDRNIISFNNTGSFANGGTFATGATSSLVFGSTVTLTTFTGNVNLGASNTVTFNNSDNIQFLGTLIFNNSGAPRTAFNVNPSVNNFSVASTASFGNGNDVTLNNTGTVVFGGNMAVGLDNTFTLNNAVTTVTFNGQVQYFASTVNYNNSGTVTFNNSVLTPGGLTGNLVVNFANTANTTYNGQVLLTANPGANITYRFAGGRTANINNEFTLSAGCTGGAFVVTNTGAGTANLVFSAAPANRSWLYSTVSNINASPANVLRGYFSTDAGGNTGIDFNRHNSNTTNRTLFWVAGGPQGGTNTLWSNLNNWSFEPDSYVPVGCLPTVADSVVFGHNDISFSAANATVDVNGNYAVAGMRWSVTDVTPANPILRSVGGAIRTLTVAGAFDCYRTAGNVTFQNESAANRLNFTFTGARRVPANGWNDFRTNGVDFPREVIFNGNADNTRWRLLTNLSATISAGANPVNNGQIFLQRGVFDTNGQDLFIGRFSAASYTTPANVTTNFTANRELIISGDSDWELQGRNGVAGGLVGTLNTLDLNGAGLVFNNPSATSSWRFTGRNVAGGFNTDGAWVTANLGRSGNVFREVPDISVATPVADMDFNTDTQATAFRFRRFTMENAPLYGLGGVPNRQVYFQTWDNANTQLIFTDHANFGNNTNQGPANDVGTVVRGRNVVPNAGWTNVNTFEDSVTIGTNSIIPFWGSYRFMGPVRVGELSQVFFDFRPASAIPSYRFDANVTLDEAVIANFRGRIFWPNTGTSLNIGLDAIAYVGDVPSSTVFPTEYVVGTNYNNWQDIVLGNQGRLILNNGEGGGGIVENNIIANLTFGEFSIVELNTEINTTNASGTPRTRVTGTMSSTFSGVCSSWASLRSILEGRQAQLIVNSAQNVNALVVRDVRVIENVAGDDVTINFGADAGNNAGANSLAFVGSRTGRNFYWVGGTNKNKTINSFRRAADTNYDGTPDDNGDNVLWSNPANWYTEDSSQPVRTSLTAAMISNNNQCVPTIIDNVYFIDDSFRGGLNTGTTVFTNRRNVLMDLPQGQARNFIWNITATAFTGSANTGANFIASCSGANCGGPAIFTNEQQPILPTTEMQIAGNLQWSGTGGTMSTGTGAAETLLRNNYISRFAFIGTGSSSGNTTHTISSNGQRFAGEVFFDNRYSNWTPLDPTDLNSHLHATSFPIPPSTVPGGVTAWSRASVFINQGELDMSVNFAPRRFNLEGDWTISGIFDWAQFNASTSEVVFDGAANGGADANNANIIMSENIRVPAPNQPVNSPASDPNRDYDPRRRRFYDLTIDKRQNDWDVRILNSPVSVLHNINIVQGRLWDNDEGGSVPMQIKGRLSGTGTFSMANGTTLRLGSNTAAGGSNRYGAPTYNWGTEFPTGTNGYPTTFPLGYRKQDITLHENSNVYYWVHGHQNVSIIPDYGNLLLVNPNNCVTDFGSGYACIRKRHLINEPTVTGNVSYGNASPGSSTYPVPAGLSGGTLTIKGSFSINGGVDFLDNGNQVAFLTGAGANATRTLQVGPRGFLTLGSGADVSTLDASNRTLSLTNVATLFPAGYTALDLDATSFTLYNAGVNQTVQGLSGAGNASYGHLMIANRNRTAAPAFVNKTLNAATTVRGQLRIYPNAHLVDAGFQITMTATGRVMMLSTLPGTAAPAPAANLNGNDLHDLRSMATTTLWQGTTGPNGESRLTLGTATTATTFPTLVTNAQVFLQSRTTVVYNAGVDQPIRAFTSSADTTQLYANLVLVNPNATATAPVDKTFVQAAGSGAGAPNANAAGDATVSSFVKGDLVIAPNNSLIDNGYQISDPGNVSGITFRMPVLKATIDPITPFGGRATLTAAGNTTGVNGVSKLILGTAGIATQFPTNFGGAADVEIDFEIAPNVSANLYGNVVYNSGRRQTIRGLVNNTGATMNRTYAHLTLTNPGATPNGPVPKTLAAATRVRGTITINPNNNLRTNQFSITPTVVSVGGTNSLPRLHMFSAIATATSAAAIVFNYQGAAINGPAIFTIGARGGQNSSFPVFPAYNATHLNLELGTTVAYNHASSTSTVAAPANQNVQALANATDAQATYANLWIVAAENTLPNEVNAKTIVAGTVTSGAGTGFTENRVRGSLAIAPLANLVDNGLQINGTGATAQDLRMFATVAATRTYMNTGVPGSYAANSVFESIAFGSGSSIFGGGGTTALDGTSALTIGNATTATVYPTFTGANGFVDANIDMAAGTYVRYNAGVNQNIRSLFAGTLTAGNNYANVELVNPGAAAVTKTLLGQVRLRGNLMIGGRVASNRFNAGTITYEANGQANTLVVGTFNINIQGNWATFSSGNQATLSATFAPSGAANTVNNIFDAGSPTGTQRVVFEGGNAQTLITGTTPGATPTVPNNFVNVELNKTPAASIANRTVSVRVDPARISRQAIFTNGYFWSNVDGSESNGTTAAGQFDDDNVVTFLDNAGTVMVAGTGTFPGAPGANNLSYVRGAVRKIGRSNVGFTGNGTMTGTAYPSTNAFDFPVGHPNGNFYAPMGVHTLTATSDFTARYYPVAGDLSNNAGSLAPQPLPVTLPRPYTTANFVAPLVFVNQSEFWTLDGTTTVNFTGVGVKLSWDLTAATGNRTAGVAGLGADKLNIAHWKTANTAWVPEGKQDFFSNGFPDAQGVQWTAATVNHNGPLTNAEEGLTLLPIQLLSFEAAQRGQVVDLTWRTAQEINNDFFTIERSADGISFAPIINRIPAKNGGNSRTTLSYADVDPRPLMGRNYYRLKQTDKDGTFSYSKIVVVYFEGEAASAQQEGFKIYPNPVEGGQDLNIVVYDKDFGPATLVIYDATGREMYRQGVPETNLHTVITYTDLRLKLATGAYYVRVAGARKSYTGRFVIR